VVGDMAVGDKVAGLGVVRLSVVGLAVVGDTVCGLPVCGLAVVGDMVEVDVVGRQKRTTASTATMPSATAEEMASWRCDAAAPKKCDPTNTRPSGVAAAAARFTVKTSRAAPSNETATRAWAASPGVPGTTCRYTLYPPALGSVYVAETRLAAPAEE